VVLGQAEDEEDKRMMVADPYESALPAQEISANGKDIISAGDSDLDLPGASVDGYQFTTTAEPLLLELESTVAMLEVPHRAKSSHKLQSHHPQPVKRNHVRSLEKHESVKSEPVNAKESATTISLKQEATTASTASTSSSSGMGNGQLLSDVTVSTGVSLHPCRQDSTHPCVVSMDSGHSLISGPPELIRKLKEHTMPPGACTEEETANMPDVSFVLGGKLFTLTPMDYLIELEGQCTPAFRERPYRNGHDWVLGEHFMRTFYSVFNYDDMRVGLSRMGNIRDHLETIMKPVEQASIKA
jgi:hypothetical protein